VIAVTGGQIMATAMAWLAVIIILATTVMVMWQRHGHPDRTEVLVGLLGALNLAIAGAATATLAVLPAGSIDLDSFRLIFLIGPRAMATVLFGAILLRRLGWRPWPIGKFLE
jgi:hypothetical protein